MHSRRELIIPNNCVTLVRHQPNNTEAPRKSWGWAAPHLLTLKLVDRNTAPGSERIVFLQTRFLDDLESQLYHSLCAVKTCGEFQRLKSAHISYFTNTGT